MQFNFNQINPKEINLRQIIGLIIWWTEGARAYEDKRWQNSWVYNVEITNTDPQIIKLFIEFLRQDLSIDESRLKLQLQIYQGNNREELEKYWSRITNIPVARFNKTLVKTQNAKAPKIDKSLGTCKIRYSDKELYLRLSDRLDHLLREAKIRNGV